MLIELFLTFAKIGLFTFGGGYAMISLIENVCVETKKWITHEEMMDVTVIAESTPGPIAINCATYVGYKKAGIPGALISTIGMILPSFIIIFLISKVFDNFLEITIIANAFKGIKIAVGFLIVQAGLKLLKQLDRSPMGIGLLCVAFGAMMATDIFGLPLSSILLMVFGAVVSLSLFALRKGGKAK